ncbi:MAG: DUF1513 domain-containing protein [Pseudomonadota bacterium]
MTSRRAFLGGLAAATALPAPSWADAGHPSHITAARDADGAYALYGLRETGDLAFRVALPSRGHAAAAHPTAPEAVAFARRPGTFALVLDCTDGAVCHRLDAAEGRHFYGHGAFSEDGTRLFTTENEIETGEGLVGIWDRTENYRRVGEFRIGGIGPHEMLRIPGRSTLAVAIGGIRTHPERGRDKLNLDTMRPGLALFTEEGALLDRVEVPAEIHRNSLRHIAAREDGLVACACQWQGDAFDAPPLLALYRESKLDFVEIPGPAHRRMKGYAGSVALHDGGRRVAITSPRGGVVVSVDVDGGYRSAAARPDISGVAAGRGGALTTDGMGAVHRLSGQDETGLEKLAQHRLAFDNHLIRLDVGGGA